MSVRKHQGELKIIIINNYNLQCISLSAATQADNYYFLLAQCLYIGCNMNLILHTAEKH